MSRKRQRTTTSPFGSAGRVSHNADPFYASRLYADQPQEQAHFQMHYCSGMFTSSNLFG
jgi:hypothetical protein